MSKLRGGMVVEEDVLLHGELADRAVPHPLLGDVGHARVDALVEGGGGDVACP